MRRDRTSVLIVGAGPAGLALANDLGRRGVACMLVEQEREQSRLPKMKLVPIDAAATAPLYGRRLSLVRPDGIVAWRADAEPDPTALLDRVRGAAPTEA